MSYSPNGSLTVQNNYIYMPDASFLSAPHGRFIPIGNEPLFQHLPEINDINQGGLKDCYLLSSLISIINHSVEGQEFINNMICLLPNGLVIVRFFHVYSSSPLYIAIDKTRFSFYKNDVCHKGLWVFFIEKAYAAYRKYIFCEDFKLSGFNYTDLLNMGESRISFKIFLNIKGNSLKINSGDKLWNDDLITIFTEDDNQETPKKSNILRNYEVIFKQMSKEPTFPVIYRSLGVFVKVISHHLSVETKKNARAMFVMKGLCSEVIIAFIGRWLPQLNETIKKLLVDYIKKTFPGKRGSNQYSQDQLIEYKKIHDALKDNQLVTITSAQEIEKDNGLVKEHIYSVINCAERDGVKYLVAVNPWQRYVRKYRDKIRQFIDHNGKQYTEIVLSASTVSQQVSPDDLFRHREPSINSAKPIPENYSEVILRGGMFELSLEDYTKNFTYVTIATFPPKVLT